MITIVSFGYQLFAKYFIFVSSFNIFSNLIIKLETHNPI